MTGLIFDDDEPKDPPKGMKDSIPFHLAMVQEHFIPLLKGSGIKSNIGEKGVVELWTANNCIPMKTYVWVRKTEKELDDYPRWWIPRFITDIMPEDKILSTARNWLSTHNYYFCVLPLRRGEPLLFWADRYDSIPEELQRVGSSTSTKLDRLTTLSTASNGKWVKIENLLLRLNKLIEGVQSDE